MRLLVLFTLTSILHAFLVPLPLQPTSSPPILTGARNSLVPASRSMSVRMKKAGARSVVALDLDGFRETFRAVFTAGACSLSVLSLGLLARSSAAGGGNLNPRELVAASATRLATLSPSQLQRLFLCLLLDIVGSSPELLLPGPVGESIDLLWSPVYAFLLFQTFGDQPFTYKCILAVSGLVEEALPFLSFVPSATIGWLLQSSKEKIVTDIKINFDHDK
ncbi:hypothetical protein GUITHDRAFT_148446 [Guillardia theta CCMP2712]|uniref:Uncharacterized protein n=1 Tax=Guillardia theta (strain CCMP2712) TaxID=905079 RepID=L1I8Y9_GUITC|nr:hypothetical protein GUITHDRAFT_148446 [Guillardia theta CCMP2712]EKX32698.1 hypothetical protein GUITHDRAFT_148446 [Guillardia theta CCMP2712]|eukprot:XP_005819678.1 hypothetical protein GUITHDRAFT_148446 [Guillardia theta CCMP2712]